MNALSASAVTAQSLLSQVQVVHDETVHGVEGALGLLPSSVSCW